MIDRQPGSFEEAERQALLAGLALTPAERLQWLEEALAFAAWAADLPRVDHSKDADDRPRALKLP